MDHPRAKLVCTIGPASVDRVRELIDAGMDVARVNFSHGTPEEQRAAIRAVRAAAREARRTVAVLADLPGSKIRLGVLQGHRLELETGSRFALRAPAGARGQTGEVEPTTTDEPAATDEPQTAPDEPARATVEPATTNEPATATDEPETATDDETARSGPAAIVPEPTTTEEPATPNAGLAARAAEPTTSGEPATATAELPSNAEPPTPSDESPTPSDERPTPTDELPTPSGEPATPDEPAGDASGATVSRADLAASLQPGDRVLLADGAAELRVVGTEGTDVITEVVRGGTIRSRSGVNVPSDRLTGPALTDQDRAAIPRALELRADLIAQSFVRGAADIAALRALLPADGPPIVAKIETRQAVDNFDEIVAVCDGVMVARGDLGVDLPFENVPLVQKRLLRSARHAGAFTIVATQMLESMTGAPRPTRAEVSDVANAVLDGADGVMLSAETAIGDFPVEATAAMAAICAATERDGAAELRTDPPPAPDAHPEAMVHAAVALTDAYPAASAIWCFTRSGRTAEMLSLLRPKLPIVAFTTGPVTARRLCLRNAVVPVVLHARPTGEPLIKRMETAARAQGLTAPDRPTSVLLVTTTPEPGGVNRLELHEVGART